MGLIEEREGESEDDLGEVEAGENGGAGVALEDVWNFIFFFLQ